MPQILKGQPRLAPSPAHTAGAAQSSSGSLGIAASPSSSSDASAAAVAAAVAASSSTRMSLVPFYLWSSLLSSSVSLELLIFLQRLCEKRGINIHELNILADPTAQPAAGVNPAQQGVPLPLSPTELLLYPELSRLGSAIYENVSLIKLHLLVLQHFNKLVMAMLPLIDFSNTAAATSSSSSLLLPTDAGTSATESDAVGPTSAPLQLAHAIRSVRHFLLWSSKRNVWEQSLAASVAVVAKPNIDVDLLAASQVAWSKKTDHHARRTVFGQVYSQRAKLSPVHFRLVRSARAFTVNYVGMRATDAGGPYRDSIERMGSELQSPLLPLFIKAPNCVFDSSHSADGDDDTRGAASPSPTGLDVFVPRPSSQSAAHHSMFEFVGRMMGLAVRTKNLWNLSFPPLIWKMLVGEEIVDTDLRAVDALAYSQLERMQAIVAAMASSSSSSSGGGMGADSASSSSGSSGLIDPATLSSLLSSSITFTIVDSEGRTQSLLPDGHTIPVHAGNFAQYVSLTRRFRLAEFRPACASMARGLGSVLSPSVLSLLTWRELESAVVGRGLGVDDIDLLEKMTKYSSCTRGDRHVELFWRMLRTRFTDEQRAQFLIFTYGRSRLPTSSADVDTSFTLMRAQPRLPPGGPPLTVAQQIAFIDRSLPTSHTCGQLTLHQQFLVSKLCALSKSSCAHFSLLCCVLLGCVQASRWSCLPTLLST